uniref:Uncharacterized protein n=1 Tax=Anguilla anguilla TaxID=7936 RepID=A0A0E9T5Q0_ANGAN
MLIRTTTPAPFILTIISNRRNPKS